MPRDCQLSCDSLDASTLHAAGDVLPSSSDGPSARSLRFDCVRRSPGLHAATIGLLSEPPSVVGAGLDEVRPHRLPATTASRRPTAIAPSDMLPHCSEHLYQGLLLDLPGVKCCSSTVLAASPSAMTTLRCTALAPTCLRDQCVFSSSIVWSRVESISPSIRRGSTAFCPLPALYCAASAQQQRTSRRTLCSRSAMKMGGTAMTVPTMRSVLRRSASPQSDRPRTA